ncbi:MAG: Asp-tRNA(Asn)/Glu-tRNA(Gln) amidotransferase GatCAB subunit A [Actinobacteria bacterium]|nr:Asp-tRNA(Asn)/Glu-tRNA(Gln) amidotransferase GatCAB subunit A [Actinomycetota bacterium]
MTNPKDLTATSCIKLIKSKEVTATEITNIYLDRSKRVNSQINSLITICTEHALEQAKLIDENLDDHMEKPLLGVPISVKDVISTSNILTTAGSNILSNYIPPFDATAVKKLKDAGAVIISKANCDEFAMGSSNENSFFKCCRNPWDTEKVPGGSSGGSAASVAASQSLLSIGSDTGGSIRQPASLCGVVGLKPTYGAVSRIGLIAFGSSYDQIGPFAKNVEDCELLYNVIKGYDPKDLTSKKQIPDFAFEKSRDLKDIKIAICEDLINENINQNVKSVFYNTVSKISDLGATIEKINIPYIGESLPVYYLTAPSEASSNLNRFDGIKYGISDQSGSSSWDTINLTRANFGDEVKRRILLGTFALSSGYYDDYYDKAQKIRGLIIESFNKAFSNYDIVISPTSPTTAFQIGSLTNDPILMYQNDICTMPANIAGIPAISIPCGMSEGLPVGLQLMGPNFSEPFLLMASKIIEEKLSWNNGVKISI